MEPAPSFSCPTFEREYTRDFLLKEEDTHHECFVIYVRGYLWKLALESLDNRMKIWENVAGLITTRSLYMKEREAAVTGRTDNLKNKMVILETKVENRGTFQPTMKTFHPELGVQAREELT